jgi:hypothetical protein
MTAQASTSWQSILFGTPTHEPVENEAPVIVLPCHTALLGELIGMYGLARSHAMHIIVAYAKRVEWLWRDGESVDDIAASIYRAEHFAGRV